MSSAAITNVKTLDSMVGRSAADAPQRHGVKIDAVEYGEIVSHPRVE
jgi:hypothetical protein